MQKTLTSVAVSCCLLSIFHPAQADVSLTTTAVSDYTLNGISQTQGDPALQASLDWSGKNGLYTSLWTSDVDFGAADKTSREIDLYIGKYWQLNKKIGLDAGIAYYTYHGASSSDDYNYPEIHSNFNYSSSLGTSELKFFYTNNYGNLDASNLTTHITHKFQLAKGHDIKLTFDHSKSFDVDKFAWGGSDADTYDHYRVEYLTSWKKLDISLAAEDTNDLGAGYDGDSRVLLSVGKTFKF